MDRIAVVTGAAGGMGRAISARLQDDGIKVIGLDIDGPGLSELNVSGKFIGIETDLQDAAAIQQVFDRIAQDHGPVDILINNAGTCFSVFHCCQAAIKQMLGREGVRKIVNISSNGAYNFDVFDPPHYRASKAAMDTLTKDLARRYATEKIAVNSIAPAMTETPLFGVLSEDVLAKAISAMPHGRAMQASEIADWVGFLVSPAGDISSGNVIILNQGRDVR